MKNVTGAIRKKYYELLNGNLIVDGNPVPVYWKYIPSVISAPYYVLITTVSNRDRSTMQSSNTDTSVRLGIYTRDTTANPGSAADTIADQIFAIIYPTPQSTIDLSPDFQVSVLKQEGDDSPDAFQTDDAIFINRFITFGHIVLHSVI